MRTRIYDYAHVNTRVTRKTVILSALDAFISGLILMLVVGMLLALIYLMVG